LKQLARVRREVRWRECPGKHTGELCDAALAVRSVSGEFKK
jgi:hypothetical protein